EVRGGRLRHARGGDELEVEPLVLEVTLVARDQHRQVVHGVHGRDLRLGFGRYGRLLLLNADSGASLIYSAGGSGVPHPRTRFSSNCSRCRASQRELPWTMT